MTDQEKKGDRKKMTKKRWRRN